MGVVITALVSTAPIDMQVEPADLRAPINRKGPAQDENDPDATAAYVFGYPGHGVHPADVRRPRGTL